MATIHIKRKHHLGHDEARKRLEEIARELKKKLNADYAWKGESLQFKRSGASGSIDLSDEFIELNIKLGMMLAPKAFSLKHHEIFGYMGERPGGEITFGPLMMFSLVHSTLTYLETPLSNRDKGRFDTLKAVASGEAEASASGSAVFDLLKSKVLAAVHKHKGPSEDAAG